MTPGRAAPGRAIGPARPGRDLAGPYRPVTRLEVFQAVPPESRPCRNQSSLLRVFLAQPELAELRADYARNITEVWRFLVRGCSWGDGTAMPVRSRLCRELGISVSTWKVVRRWLERRGWLGTVRQGYKPGVLRAASLAGDEPNEAAIYVLCIPRGREKQQPRHREASRSVTRPLTRTPAVTDSPHGSSWAPQPRRRPPLPADAAAAVAVLRRGPFTTLTSRWVAWLARPLIRAGYTPADLGYAVHYHPSAGRHRGWLSHLAKPGPLLAWRLSRWLADPDQAWAYWREHGRWPDDARPLPSQSQRAWQHATPIGQTYVARNQAKAAAARRADPHPIAQALREQMGWAQPKGITR